MLYKENKSSRSHVISWSYVSSLDAEISSRNVFQKAVHAKILTLDQCACEDISQKTGCTW